MHLFVGYLGHGFIILSFVCGLLSALSYLLSMYSSSNTKRWVRDGRIYFWFHTLAVVGSVSCLLVILFGKYFEYYYAFEHVSIELPWYYTLSCFWEGQEGSFMLWIFWQSIIGLIFLYAHKSWEKPAMVIMASVQVFLTAMILGVELLEFSFLEWGSSPFLLMREAVSDPIFRTQPDFIPANGNGLNPLLQSYWMVIHPPVLFLGFALTLPPFALCIAGLWTKKYSDWIYTSLPWTILGAAILGAGIFMGGYWAYETLSFGGYWNWDPVENAVYVPWLILIAAVHTLVLYKKNKQALHLSVILVLSTFLLILYSTFLTRSGILGDVSVHSFTDLGLSGQLLTILVIATLATGGLVVFRWQSMNDIQTTKATPNKQDLLMLLSAIILCVMGFQVLIPTSIPVYNKFISLFGITSHRAPPANPVMFYSQFQLWLGIALSMGAGVAQFLWWKKATHRQILSELIPSVIITLGLFAIVIPTLNIHQFPYMLLTLTSLYMFVSATQVLIFLIRKNPRLIGGALSHIGVALMLVGLVTSSGNSRVVSLNQTGSRISNDFPKEFNRENLLLFVNEPRQMYGYTIVYKGERLALSNTSGYIKKSDVEQTEVPSKVIARKNIEISKKVAFHIHDTLVVRPENTYYEIEMRKNEKTVARLFPRIQYNASMGGVLSSPHIVRQITSDLYTHVSLAMNKDDPHKWSAWEEQQVKIDHPFFVNDYVATLDHIERVFNVPGVELSTNDVAVKAHITIMGEEDVYKATPVFLIVDASQVGFISSDVGDLGVEIRLINIHPQTQTFTLEIRHRQKDWVVIKAIEKPFINILWLGTAMLIVGMSVAFVRRV